MYACIDYTVLVLRMGETSRGKLHKRYEQDVELRAVHKTGHAQPISETKVDHGAHSVGYDYTDGGFRGDNRRDVLMYRQQATTVGGRDGVQRLEVER